MALIDKVKKARERAREAQESLYDDICTITEYRKVIDEDSGITDLEEVTVVTDQACKLSFETLSSADSTDEGNTKIAQTTKLFISPDVSVKPGCKITVTRRGVEMIYTHSGVSHLDDVHQEIVLDLYKGDA